MKNRNIILLVIIIAIAVIGYMFLGTRNKAEVNNELSNSSTTSNVVSDTGATTTNTVVKTVVKNTTTTKSPSTNSYIRIGQRVLINGVYVTPTKVTYDSRCPTDVKCIQAGTVELGVLIESGSLSQNIIITLGKAVYFAERQVTLTSVTPSKLSTKTITESDYRFVISVK